MLPVYVRSACFTDLKRFVKRSSPTSVCWFEQPVSFVGKCLCQNKSNQHWLIVTSTANNILRNKDFARMTKNIYVRHLVAGNFFWEQTRVYPLLENGLWYWFAVDERRWFFESAAVHVGGTRDEPLKTPNVHRQHFRFNRQFNVKESFKLLLAIKVKNTWWWTTKPVTNHSARNNWEI